MLLWVISSFVVPWVKVMRAFPVLVIIAALSLLVRMSSLWNSFSSIDQTVAQERASDRGNPKKTRGISVANAQEVGERPQDAALSSVEGTGIINEQQVDELPLPTVQGLEIDPFSMTDEELEILQSLSRRREAIVEKERELDQRKVLLQAAEKKLDEKLSEMQKLQETIQALVRKHDAQADQQMESLVKIYESMKPKEAARIFDQLDMVVLLDVIERMKERKTAPILASMSADRAKAVTLELAQRGALPLPKE